MIYLVSNMHRSGSSMMMRCLEAGGLTPVYDRDSIKMNESAPSDYIPNPNGFYQFTNEIGDQFAAIHQGKLIKCPIRALPDLPLAAYKLCFMRRNPAEIRASMAKWTPYHSWGKEEVMTYLQSEVLATLQAKLIARGDFEITVLNYADVVAQPLVEFAKLSSWGIDVSAAAAMVQPELYRFNLENL